MKKESLLHIKVVTNNMIKVMKDCSQGIYITEDNISIPMPNNPRFIKQVRDQLIKLCENIVSIENET